MEYFVNKNSIVREIWGKSDTILLIFAGAAAEFALNKAVDWLYVTGKLPKDPLGRLFSTVSYARKIVFSENSSALKTIDHINAIHAEIETTQGAKIPDWAYRDVLFMLIDYSIRSFEILERKLNDSEKAEVFAVFYKLGDRMNISNLPKTYEEWVKMRKNHIINNLEYSQYTAHLFKQYKKHLGTGRYLVLLEVQKLITPQHVFKLLRFKRGSLLQPLVFTYKVGKGIYLDRLIKFIILPSAYKNEIKMLDYNHNFK